MTRQQVLDLITRNEQQIYKMEKFEECTYFVISDERGMYALSAKTKKFEDLSESSMFFEKKEEAMDFVNTSVFSNGQKVVMVKARVLTAGEVASHMIKLSTEGITILNDYLKTIKE